MELEFKSLQVMDQFVTADECRELIRACPELIPFAIECYSHARSQPDFRTKKFASRYASCQFLKLLRLLGAASDDVCAEVVRRGGLLELAAALALDANGRAEGLDLFWDVLHAAHCVWHILLANHGTLRAEVRKHTDILAGVHLRAAFTGSSDSSDSELLLFHIFSPFIFLFFFFFLFLFLYYLILFSFLFYSSDTIKENRLL